MEGKRHTNKRRRIQVENKLKPNIERTYSTSRSPSLTWACDVRALDQLVLRNILDYLLRNLSWVGLHSLSLEHLHSTKHHTEVKGKPSGQISPSILNHIQVLDSTLQICFTYLGT